MSQKRYRVNAPVAGAFAQRGVFQCRVGYSVEDESGLRIIRSQTRAPLLQVAVMPEEQVVGTANRHAQRCIEMFNAPRNTIRNGVQRPAGPMFVDVTDSTGPDDVDVDLDPIFDAHEKSRS